MRIKDLKKKNIHVLGVSGAEGSAVLEFLYDHGIKKLTAHDFCDEEEFEDNFFAFHDWMTKKEKEKFYRSLRDLKVKFKFKGSYLSGIKKADMVFVPQSWFRYPQNELLMQMKGKVEFFNITKLYFQLAPCKIIAITGTSGKSTTAALVYEILKHGYKQGKVYFTGNDRENVQILNEMFNIKKNDVLILEVSNRQLMIDLKKSPCIGIITNISPNHLDDHKNYMEYIRVKKSLLKYQIKSDYAVLNYDNEITKDIGTETSAQVYFFSRKSKLEQGAYVRHGEIVIMDSARENRICSVLDLNIPGPHNIENVMAASLSAYLFGINTKKIRESVYGFKGIRSRLEFVKELNGVKYYEDSSACNPDGTAVAVQSFKFSILLIAGGARKRPYPGEFDKMGEAVVSSKVKAVFLIGEKADAIKNAIKKACVKLQVPGPIIKICESLKEAVDSAKMLAKKGDVVILSPGCESFDMFVDYRDRGRQYKRLVRRLKENPKF